MYTRGQAIPSTRSVLLIVLVVIVFFVMLGINLYMYSKKNTSKEDKIKLWTGAHGMWGMGVAVIVLIILVVALVVVKTYMDNLYTSSNKFFKDMHRLGESIVFKLGKYEGAAELLKDINQ